MAREVEVIIRGARGSGRTTVLSLIYQKFKAMGLNVTYDEPVPSDRRAVNFKIEDMREEDIQPMNVHLREELK